MGRHWRDGSSPDTQSLSPDACNSSAVPGEAGLASLRLAEGIASRTGCSAPDGAGGTTGARTGVRMQARFSCLHASSSDHRRAGHNAQVSHGCNLVQRLCCKQKLWVSHAGSARQQIEHLSCIL